MTLDASSEITAIEIGNPDIQIIRRPAPTVQNTVIVADSADLVVGEVFVVAARNPEDAMYEPGFRRTPSKTDAPNSHRVAVAHGGGGPNILDSL